MDLDLGNVVIRVINTSINTLEAMLRTYKTCKSPRHKMKPCKLDVKITKKQIERGVAGHRTEQGCWTPRAPNQTPQQNLARVSTEASGRVSRQVSDHTPPLFRNKGVFGSTD